LQHLVWSKLIYVLGFLHPSATPFDPDTELAMQKAFFDHMWTMSLEQMIGMIGGNTGMADLDFSVLAQTLNSGVAQHSNDLRSFEQAKAAEMEGAIDVCGDIILDIVSDIAARKGEPIVSKASAEWPRLRAQWTRMLSLALKNNPTTRDHIRTLYIEACLHAGFRWDKARRFKGNDIYDFHHADAALAYCRAFFTERPLQSLIQARHLTLDKAYDCCVIADVSEAIAWLSKLNAETPYSS
jgi:hypothetical protein